MRDGDGVNVGVGDGVDEGFEFAGVDGEEQFAVGADALGDAEAEGFGDKALGRGLEPVVELAGVPGGRWRWCPQSLWW